MGRRGRPKKQNVVRFPCGKIKEEAPPFNMQGVREAIKVVDNKVTHLFERVPALQALFDEGRIREHQRLGCELYIDLVIRYRRAIEARSGPKQSSPEGAKGGTPVPWELLTTLEQARIEAVEDDYDKLFVKLCQKRPLQIKRALDLVCLDNQYPNRVDHDSHGRTELDWLRVAADDVAEFFGLETRKRA